MYRLMLSVGNKQGKFDNFHSLRFTNKDLSVNELIDVHLSQGYCICSQFEGKRRASSVIGANWIGFDFDNGYNGEFDEYAGLLYETASSTPEAKRYRYILFCDKFLNNNELKESLLYWHSRLVTLDKSCKDTSRLWYGNNKRTFHLYDHQDNYKPFSYDEMKTNGSEHTITKYNDIISSCLDCSYERPKHRLSRYQQNEIISRCKLLQNIESSTHDEWFRLMLQLQYIEGGKSIFLDAMSRRPNTESDLELAWDFCLDANYRSPNCDFCRFRKECSNTGNHIWDLSSSHVRRISVVSKTTHLSDAEIMLRETIAGEINNPSPGLVLIEAETGLGKSRELKEILRSDYGYQATIGFPTHQLKEQNSIGYQIPEFPIGIPNGPLVRQFWDAGLDTSDILSMPELNECAEYLEWREAVAEAKNQQIVSTTHARIRMSGRYPDITIFDEDPFHTYMPIGRVSLKSLFNVSYSLGNKHHEFGRYITDLFGMREGTVSKNPNQGLRDPQIVLDIFKRQKDLKIFEPIVPLIMSNSVYKDIWNSDSVLSGNICFCTRYRFPVDRKIIVLSASPMSDIYRLVYPNMKHVQIPRARPSGQIIQYPELGYGLTYTNEKPEQIQAILDGHDGWHVVSHSKTAFDKDAYFGNLQGMNHLEGKDLLVLGTPHRPSFVYHLYAWALGYETDVNMKPEMMPVEHNGYSFRFPSFDDQFVQRIQLSILTAELSQAVGRARALRYPTTVHLYSSLPLPEADSFAYTS